MKIIFVSRGNIRQGVPRSTYRCPVALALSESSSTPGFHEGIWAASQERAVWFTGDKQESYPFGRRTRRFIQRFDNREKVHPFFFILRKGDQK